MSRGLYNLLAALAQVGTLKTPSRLIWCQRYHNTNRTRDAQPLAAKPSQLVSSQKVGVTPTRPLGFLKPQGSFPRNIEQVLQLTSWILKEPEPVCEWGSGLVKSGCHELTAVAVAVAVSPPRPRVTKPPLAP